MNSNISDTNLKTIKILSSPIFVSFCAVVGTITWLDNLYAVVAIMVVFIAFSQYLRGVVIREERGRERAVVYNSLRRAIVEYLEESNYEE